MCLAIPARVKTLEANNMAEVEIMGISRHVSLDLIPGAEIGDHVLVHAGFAIQVVDEQFANETIDLLRQLDLYPADDAEAE